MFKTNLQVTAGYTICSRLLSRLCRCCVDVLFLASSQKKNTFDGSNWPHLFGAGPIKTTATPFGSAWFKIVSNVHFLLQFDRFTKSIKMVKDRQKSLSTTSGPEMILGAIADDSQECLDSVDSR